MVEYALLAGFLAVTAGATLPAISEHVGFIFFELSEYLEIAAGAGGSPSPTGT